MMLFFIPIFSVSMIFIVNLFLKQKEGFAYYMKLFFVLLACEFFLHCSASFGEETRIDYVINGPYKMYVSTIRNIVDEKDRQVAKNDLRLMLRDKWFKDCVDLKLKGYQELEKVQYLALFIPDEPKKLAVYSTIDTLAIALVTSTWQGRLVGAAIVTCGNYLKGSYDKWEEMEVHLKAAQNFFNFSEVYQDLLFRDDELEEIVEEEEDDCEDEHCSPEKIYKQIRNG